MDIVGFLLTSAVAGFIGNRTDAVLYDGLHRLFANFKKLQQPELVTIELAIQSAYLYATLAINNRYLEELKGTLGRSPWYPKRNDPFWWPKQLDSWLKASLRRTQRRTSSNPQLSQLSLSERDLIPLLTPADNKVEELLFILTERVTTTFIQELGDLDFVLTSKPNFPPRFIQLIREGWTNSTQDLEVATLPRVTWFDLFRDFFNSELQSDERLFYIVQSKLLAGIDVKIDDILDKTSDIATEVQGLRLDLTRQLRSLKLQVRRLNHRPEYEKYAGIWVGNKVSKILFSYESESFVGREDALQNLDKFVSSGVSGRLLITAPAGYGKSSLLAHWIADQATDANVFTSGRFIAYHFFGDPNTRSQISMYRNILRQLYIYLDLIDRSLPNSEDELRDRIYGLLGELNHHAQRSEPLVIVLDGLDEMEDKPVSPFPDNLPDEVFIITSFRASTDSEICLPADWLKNTKRITLGGLSPEDIGSLLKVSQRQELASLADDPAIIGVMADRTKGYTLFLKYLVDDLHTFAGTEDELRSKIEQISDSFNSYIHQQFEELHSSYPEFAELFTLLSILKGPITDQEVAGIIGIAETNLAKLLAPRRVARWVDIKKENGRRTFAFHHSSIADAVRQQWRVDARTFLEKKLLPYCRQWRDYAIWDRRYILRFYGEHLSEDALVDELYTLARDQDFLQAQSTLYPEQPSLPLKVIQLALQGAAGRDDGKSMAEFLLMHAYRVHEVLLETPLTALRSGDSHRAWQLVAMAEASKRVLWNMLLIWELLDENENDLADSSLIRLLADDGPRLDGFQLDNFVEMLSRTFDFCLPSLERLIETYISIDGIMKLGDLLVKRGEYDKCVKVLTILNRRIGQLDSTHKSRVLSFASKINKKHTDSKLQETILSFGADGNTTETVEILIRMQDYQHAQEITKLVNDAYQKAELLGKIAKAQAQAGEYQQARDTFDLALDAARIVDGASRKARMLGEIAKAQAQAGMYQPALDTAQLISYMDQKADALSEIIIAQARAGIRAGMYQPALDTVQLVNDESRKAELLGKIAKAQAQAGEYQQARDTFDLALDAAKLVSNSSRKADLLGELIIAQARTGMYQLALSTVQLISYMAQKARVLCDIAKAQAQAGEYQQARDTFDLALDAAKLVNDASRKARVLNKIALEQAQAGMYQPALDTVRHINDASQKADALCDIAKAQTRAGMYQLALETAKLINDVSKKGRVLSNIAKAQAQAGEYQQARDTFGLALDAPRPVDGASRKARVLGEIAKAQAQAGMYQPALDTTQLITDIPQKADTLSEIAKAQARAGMYQLALDTAQLITYASRKAYVLDEIAKAQAQAGEFQQARDTFDLALDAANLIPDVSRKARVLCDIAKAQAQAGEYQQTRDTFDLALDAAKLIPDVSRKVYMLCEIAIAKAQAGMYQLALDAAKLIPDVSRKAYVLDEIAKTQAQAGEYQQARDTFDLALDAANLIPDVSRKVYVLGEIAKAQAQAGMYQPALDTAQLISYAFRKVNVLGNIAKAQAQAGEYQQARDTFGLALDAANLIPVGSRRVDALGEIAKAQAQAGMYQPALDTARLVDGVSQRARMLGEIAKAQAQAGMYQPALDTAQLISYASRKANVLGEIAKAQAQAGMYQPALDIARLIEDVFPESRCVG